MEFFIFFKSIIKIGWLNHNHIKGICSGIKGMKKTGVAKYVIGSKHYYILCKGGWDSNSDMF